MINILCYGDSNTYGYNPTNGLRFSNKERWTCLLQDILGDNYNVIEEGLNGRTINYSDPLEPYKNGMTYLKPCLLSHRPLDIIFVMLGTNDCNTDYNLSSEDIADEMELMIKTIDSFLKEKQENPFKIILACPVAINDNIENSVFSYQVGLDGVKKSKELASLYKDLANKYNCSFFDACNMFEASPIDSEHMDKNTHKIFAEELAKIIKDLTNC